MKTIYTFIFIVVVLFAGACSGDKSGSGEHVFKDQADALKKAERVEAELMKQAQQQQQAIEQQSR
jgi:hypothetical protein